MTTEPEPKSPSAELSMDSRMRAILAVLEELVANRDEGAMNAPQGRQGHQGHGWVADWWHWEVWERARRLAEEITADFAESAHEPSAHRCGYDPCTTENCRMRREWVQRLSDAEPESAHEQISEPTPNTLTVEQAVAALKYAVGWIADGHHRTRGDIMRRFLEEIGAKEK